MAAFSYQHDPFHVDSVFFPNTPIKNLSGFMEEGNNNIFSQFYPSLPPHELLPLNDHSSLASDDDDDDDDDDNEPNSSVTKKQSTGSSSSSSSVVVDKLVESGELVTQQLNHHHHHNNSMDNKKRKKKTSNASSSTSHSKDNVGPDEKKGRIKKQKIEKKEEDKKSKAKKKVPEEEPPTGYIHVRARRGQATDSHSLAERVRREKISERMKMLQRLVPGCDKVTGKALMLDEIINYVQSLQNQVEFLSMKLASVNPLFYDFGMDLDALTIRPEGLSNYTPSLSPMQHQQQSPAAPPTAFPDATTATTTTAAAVATFAAANNNNYLIPAIDSLLLQAQRPWDFIQENGSLMWDVYEQRQKFLNQSGIISDSLCSFH